MKFTDTLGAIWSFISRSARVYNDCRYSDKLLEKVRKAAALQLADTIWNLKRMSTTTRNVRLIDGFSRV